MLKKLKDFWMGRSKSSERKLLEGLIGRALFLLKSDQKIKLSEKYNHPRHGVLLFRLDLNDSDNGLELAFYVAIDSNSYCRTRLIQGNKVQITRALERIIDDVTPIEKDLPNYYRILFDNN